MKGLTKPNKDQKNTILGCTNNKRPGALPLGPTRGFGTPHWLPGDWPTCYYTLVYDRRSYGITILIMAPPPSQICYFKTLNINLYECYKLKKKKKNHKKTKTKKKKKLTKWNFASKKMYTWSVFLIFICVYGTNMIQ